MSENYETRGDRIDWGGIEREAIDALRALRLAWAASEKGLPEIHAKLVRDIYVPAIKVLAEFIACVEVAEEGEE